MNEEVWLRKSLERARYENPRVTIDAMSFQLGVCARAECELERLRAELASAYEIIVPKEVKHE